MLAAKKGALPPIQLPWQQSFTRASLANGGCILPSRWQAGVSNDRIQPPALGGAGKSMVISGIVPAQASGVLGGTSAARWSSPPWPPAREAPPPSYVMNPAEPPAVGPGSAGRGRAAGHLIPERLDLGLVGRSAS
jgi:hypothetical protein